MARRDEETCIGRAVPAALAWRLQRAHRLASRCRDPGANHDSRIPGFAPRAALWLVAGAILLCSPVGWPADAPKYREFADPRLKQGRAVWLGTCEACHAHDLAGAPLVSDKKAWAPRLAKGQQTLYASALGGLTGPKGTQMPARGGNSKLSDDEVKAAVDYMAAIVK